MQILLVVAVLAALAVAGAPAPAPTHVVFVCEHGSVKSLIAMAWFDRLAAERGLKLRARSRGTTPDASVPPAIVEKLRGDGFDVSAFEPRALSKADLEGAARVVAIGVDVAPVTGGATVAVDRWDAIPPATEGYDQARDALKAEVEALLRKLAE